MAIPAKLKPGSHVRIIAPSCSLAGEYFTEETKKRGLEALSTLGLTVSFGEHVYEIDASGSSSIEHRLADLHAAFADDTVDMVLCARGGWNVNQLLRGIDYDLIRKHPKILCGFSDITALGTAIFVQSGLVTYSGPNFSTFGRPPCAAYIRDAFKTCLFTDEAFDVQPSKTCCADPTSVKEEPTDGPVVLHEGEATGQLLGGNLCTLSLLQGTEYFPDIRNSILFIEDDHEALPRGFDRDLQSLIHQPGFESVRGLVIGRFETASGMTMDTLKTIIETKAELKNIPVVVIADIGHTLPMITFPIGGSAELKATKEGMQLRIFRH